MVSSYVVVVGVVILVSWMLSRRMTHFSTGPPPLPGVQERVTLPAEAAAVSVGWAGTLVAALPALASLESGLEPAAPTARTV